MPILPTLSVKYDVDQLSLELEAIQSRLKDRRAVHTIIGQTLFNRTRQRFLDEISPEGKKWAPLSALTISLGRSPTGILRKSGELFRSIHFKADSQKAEVGTNLNHPKVLVHQYGATIKPVRAKALSIPRPKSANRPFFAKSVSIPARPFIGVNKGDEDYLQKNLTFFFHKG